MTQDELKRRFKYIDNGFFIRKIDSGNGRKAGSLVRAHVATDGYRIVSIDNRNLKLHRMVFLYHHGYLPRFIDHIDQNRANCRIENLREATTSQNMANIRKYKQDALSIYKGVTRTRHGVYQVSIRCNGHSNYIGRFKSEYEAALAYDTKARELFGEFACTNF